MSKSLPWSIASIVLGLCLLVPIGAVAQSETPPPSRDGDASGEGLAGPAPLPDLEGLAWYRSIDLTGPEIQSSLNEDEVADWSTMLDTAGASFDQLEYTYHAAFDPSRLPDIGGIATVRVAGAEEAALLEAVVQDIVAQVVGLGHDAPVPQQTTIGEKDVTVLSLPAAAGFEDATVYVHGDVAYVVLLSLDLVAAALDQLP